MPSRPVSALSAAAVSAARRQGRVYNNRVYSTKSQADQARAAASVQGGGSVPRAPTPPSPTSGWVSKEAVTSWHPSAVTNTYTHTVRLFKIGDADANVALPTACKVQGVRIKVTCPLQVDKFRFAAAFVNAALSSASIPPERFEAVAGWVGTHDAGANGLWLSPKLQGLDTLRRPQQEDPSLMLVMSAQTITDDAQSTSLQVEVHVTYLCPKDTAMGHAL